MTISRFDSNPTGDAIGDYRHPFKDLASTTMPENLKDFFEMALGIYYQYDIVRLAVNKLAEYAITEFVYKAEGKEGPKIQERYKEAFERVLKIKSLLIRVGQEYYIVGNSFLTFNFGVKRRLLCPHCHVPETDSHTPEVDDKDRVVSHGINIVNVPDVKYKNGKFIGTCPECSRDSIEFHVDDQYPQELDNVIVKTWPIKQIDVIPNKWNDKEIIIWEPDADTVSAVKEGDIRIIRDFPLEILKSIEKDHAIELDNVFHFKMVGPADSHDELGKGLVLCAYKNIFHNAVLAQASEAVAFEHIVPLRVLYPESIGGIPPQSVLMTRFKEFVEEEFVSWRRDPNHVIVSPFPLGQIYLGGQGRAFLPTPEIQAGDQKTFMAFGLPMPLMDGNATYASNSISLRIIENHFLTYRDQLQEVLHWLSDMCDRFLEMGKCECCMQEFKMLDDIQHKTQMINMAMGRKIPMKTIYEMYDMDYNEIILQLEKETLDDARIQALASSKMMEIQSEQQMKSELLYQNKMAESALEQQKQTIENDIMMISRVMRSYPNITLDQAIMMNQQAHQQQAMMQQQAMQQQQAEQARMLFLMDRMGKAQWSNVRAQREGAIYEIMDNLNPTQVAQGAQQNTHDSIEKYLLLPRDQQEAYLRALFAKDPVYYESFVQQLNALGADPSTQHPMQGG